MTFLAPAALFGVLLLSIPIVVHLLKPRKMRRTPFSSLRWLKQTHQRLSRRIQWHQWLLFALRASLIVLLVLALARPLIYTSGSSQPSDRFVVIDVSRSMGYQPKDLPSTLDKARELAANLISQNRPGDRTAILFTGSHTQLLTPPVADATPFLPALKTVKPSASDTDLSSALPIIRPLLQHARPNAEVELYFFTDNHQDSWRQSQIAGFVKDVPMAVRVQVVNLGAGFAQNGWISGARLIRRGPEEDRILRVDLGCVGDTKQERSLRLAGLRDFGEDSQSVSLTPGEITRVEFKVPASLGLKGQVAEFHLDPPDTLPSDDRFFLPLAPQGAAHVLLIEPAAVEGETRSAGLYLRTGIEALAESGSQVLEVTRRTPATLTGRDFQDADVVLMASVPDLPEATLAALEARVRTGGGLVVFLGPRLNADFYNNRLFKPLQPADGLLPMPLKTGPDLLVYEGNPGRLTGIRWNHPLLAPLYDPVLGDLSQSRFRFHGAFSRAAGPEDKVLMKIDDDVPALIEHPVGAGRVLVFNTTAGDAWSDLPRRGSFVPLLDRILSYLSGPGSRRSFTVWDSVALPLAAWTAGERVAIVTPSGSKITPRLSIVSAKTFFHINQIAEPGIYRVERTASDKNFEFVVNVGRGDSVLSPMDPSTLKQWWSPATFEMIGAETAARRFQPQGNHWALWPLLILLGGLLLFVETYVVHYLCPRVNPKIADSVVPQRGILQPVKTAT
jgi:hypothetical protein